MPVAARASRLCVRPRVTDAGWARSATRLPSNGRRSSGSASSRSIPNKVMGWCLRKVRGEASGVVEVGLVALRVGERPVGFRAILLFEDCGQSELPDALRLDADR